MAGKGSAVRYNVPMRYAGKPEKARAYLAGRRSGLRDLAAREFFNHAIGMLGQAIAKFGPEGAAPFALPVLGEAGLADMLARLAEDPEKIEAVVKALDAHPEAILLAGVCHVCGCTDDAACDGGCSWADDARTLCTKCKAAGMVPDGPGTPAPIRVVVVNRERILIRWLLATEYAYHQALKLGMEREDLVRLADGFASPIVDAVAPVRLLERAICPVESCCALLDVPPGPVVGFCPFCGIGVGRDKAGEPLRKFPRTTKRPPWPTLHGNHLQKGGR